MTLPSEETFTINCATLEANTISNSGMPPAYISMCYRYPGMPTTGTVSRTFRDLCDLRDLDDVTTKRAELCDVLFNASSVPSGTPHSGPTLTGDHYEYVVRMSQWGLAPGVDSGADSHVWFYENTGTANGRLLVVHGGHAHHGPLHADLVDIRTEARAAGYDVLVVSMPGQGPNEDLSTFPGSPYTPNTNVGYMFAHQNAPYVDGHYLAGTVFAGSVIPATSSWYVFVWPVHCVLNAIASSYDGVYATGLSGGAATMLMCAAVDPRIKAHYHVSGSGVPTYALYETANNFGDAENQLKSIMDVANHEEQNLLACSDGRRVLHVLNDASYGDGLATDPGSFTDIDVTLYGPAISYDANVVANGRWGYLVDDNDNHTWSTAIRDFIFDDIDALVADESRLSARDNGMATYACASALTENQPPHGLTNTRPAQSMTNTAPPGRLINTAPPGELL